MLPHLPEAVFWELVKRIDDVKACVALWSSHHALFNMYSKQEFWRNMCHSHFKCSTIQHNSCWCDEYWWWYGNTKGCGYCGRSLKYHEDDADCTITIDNGIGIYVCKSCKSYLGDGVIHKDQIDPWKVSLIRRLRGRKVSNIFHNYFGHKQLDRCHLFNMRCIECLKNIKNIRCPHDMCGRCCNCKYHKSHYNQATPGDIILSFDVVALINSSNVHKKRKDIKRHSIIIHRLV